jgi:serine protease AprX
MATGQLRTIPRPTALVACAVLVLAGVVVASPTVAAPQKADPGRRGDNASSNSKAHESPGKGDSNGDKIADDLQAALDTAAPGVRLDVIVQGVSGRQAERSAPSLHVGRSFHSIDGFAGSMTAGQVRALAKRPGVTRIELNGQVRAMDASGDLDYGVTAARGAGAATDGTLDGSGVGICVIDTGIDPNHQQLAGRIVGWKDWVNGRTTPYDDQGHGTHVSGIAAGLPTSAANAPYGGVATGASLIGAKVLGADGTGADADVVSAIEWCAARPDVDVISMSLGSPSSDGSDAGSQAADAAVAAGKVVVAAAGNDGDQPGTIASPGVATDVITVGAASDTSALAGSADTDSGTYLAGFSSRGPTTNPDAPIKPDVVAPGISVVSAKAGTTSGYVAMSGTSMATPFVSGVVALGLEADPSATPAQIKAALRSSAHDAGAPGPDNEWGAGLVDARAFLAALGAAGPGTGPVQGHQLIQGSVVASQTLDFPFDVSTAGQALGITLKIINGQSVCTFPFGSSCLAYEWSPDLDIFLVSPSGTVVANSKCMLSATNDNCGAAGRFETIGIANAAAGTWQLRVQSFAGTGTFQADVFGALGVAGPPPPPPSPPSAPTGLTASSTSATSVHLTWTDTSSNETNFEVARCQGAGCTTFAQVTSLPAGMTSYDDTGLTGSTPYTYRVRATNAGGASDWSSTASVVTQSPPSPPTAPTGLTYTAKLYNHVDLVWTDTSANEDGFRVMRCPGKYACSKYTEVATLPANTSSWSDTTVTASTSYYYRVDAFNVDGSASSSPLQLTTSSQPKPPAPSGLVGTATSSSSVDLSWTDNAIDDIRLELQRCQGARCSSFVTVATLPPGTSAYTDTGLAAVTPYSYRIRAVNDGGASPWSGTAGVTTLTIVPLPAAPTGVTAKAVSMTQVDVTWTDASTNESGYRVLRCQNRYVCSNYVVVATLPADSSSWSDLSVTANSYYFYKVESYNEGGSVSSTAVPVHTPSK